MIKNNGSQGGLVPHKNCVPLDGLREQRRVSDSIVLDLLVLYHDLLC